MNDKRIKEFVLSEVDVSFIKYHIRKFQTNFSKGETEDAHHDATAIVLHLEVILGLEND